MDEAWHKIFGMWSNVGWFALPLLALSIASWVWLLSLHLKLRLCDFRTSSFEKEINRRLFAGESPASVRKWLVEQEGIVPRIVSYVLLSSNHSDDVMRDRYIEASDAETEQIYREFGVLDSMVKAAPLLGLLGTVAGMIHTFAAMSTSNDLNSISIGISQALLTTQLGLLIALPGIFGLVFLKRRFQRFSLELDRLQYHIKALAGNGKALV